MLSRRGSSGIKNLNKTLVEGPFVCEGQAGAFEVFKVVGGASSRSNRNMFTIQYQKPHAEAQRRPLKKSRVGLDVSNSEHHFTRRWGGHGTLKRNGAEKMEGRSAN